MASRTVFRALCISLQLWLAAWSVTPVQPYLLVQSQAESEESREGTTDLKGLLGHSMSLPRRRSWLMPWAPSASGSVRLGLVLSSRINRSGVSELEGELVRQRRARLPRRPEPPEPPRA